MVVVIIQAISKEIGNYLVVYYKAESDLFQLRTMLILCIVCMHILIPPTIGKASKTGNLRQ